MKTEINMKTKGTRITRRRVADRLDSPRDVKRHRDKDRPIIRQNQKIVNISQHNRSK